jgi:two-component system sensor histidine kinase TctE
MAVKASIKKQLVLWLAIPLGGLWLISTIVGYNAAFKFANDVYDSELVNSSDSVAARIKVKNGHIVVDLPPAAQAILRHNNTTRFFYQVLKSNGERIAGDSVLPAPTLDLKEGSPKFSTIKIGQSTVRLAEIKVLAPEADTEPIIIQVAETMRNRKELSIQIFMNIIIPQILMVILGASAVWMGVSRGLEPLDSVQKALAKRSRMDLSPVSEEIAPEEVIPLIVSINDLLYRLREDIKAQQRFVANASHQLRTPLAGLKTYSSVGLNINSLVEMKKVMIKIDNGLDRTTHLVNQLLALARNDPGSSTYFVIKAVDLNLAVSEVIADRISLATKKKIDLSFDACPYTAILNGDATSIKQLIGNLLDNALLYTQEEGKVAVSITSDSNKIILSIKDNGPGIPNAEREKIFERFYRIDGSTGIGSGLGLAIVREVARNHDAQIIIENNDNSNGTVIKIAFPNSENPRVN